MTEAGPPILKFEQVSKWYGPVLGLNHVSLELRGGITGLVGPNGAGKSSLIRLAVGLARPTVGRVTVAGMDASDWRARTNVGYCPDIDAFYEEMTGREFVVAMARFCGYPKSYAVDRGEELLRQVGMADRANRRLRGYSKGMRQRIKLAQALIADPPLLILDEPLSGIDPVGRAELVELFRAWAADGKCLLVSSHELEELEKLTDAVAIMVRGRLAAAGPLVRIREMIEDRPLEIRLAAEPIREVAAALFGMETVLGVELVGDEMRVRARQPGVFLAAFQRACVANNWAVTRLEVADESASAVLGYLLGGGGRT